LLAVELASLAVKAIDWDAICRLLDSAEGKCYGWRVHNSAPLRAALSLIAFNGASGAEENGLLKQQKQDPERSNQGAVDRRRKRKVGAVLEYAAIFHVSANEADEGHNK
jgi:hypothetical protein